VTRARIDDHPEFPFAADRERWMAARGAHFVDAPAADSEEARLLGEFIVLAHQFAFLERLIQGEILYDLPVHLEVVAGEFARTPAEEGELLAREELGVLDWSVGAPGGLAEALDEIGIKVIQRGEAARPDSSAPAELYGAFFFEGAVGPALFAGTARNKPEATFVLAHEFAHLIADVDPYRPRFCRWDPVDFTNRSAAAEEERADRFARALLMPSELFRATVAEMGPSPADPHEADPRWKPLAAFFEVPAPLLRMRLRDLGLAPFGALPAGLSAGSGAPEAVSLPERYVNLALAAYGTRILETDVLARFLHTTEQEAVRMLDWAGVRREPEEEL
jgi:Zn-dependent peptidase ImmA (M78 family)